MFTVKIEGLDQLRRIGDKYPELFKRALSSAASTVGMTFRKIAMDEGYRGRSVLGWAPRSTYASTLSKAKPGVRASNKAFKVARQRYKRIARNYWVDAEGKRMHKIWGSTAINPYGRLINALRYKKDYRKLSGVGLLRMGFLRELRTVESLAMMAAKGGTISITPRMRRFFFALHLPLKAGRTTMTVPARPYIGRVWARHQAQMMALFRQKFYMNLDRYRAGGGRGGYSRPVGLPAVD